MQSYSRDFLAEVFGDSKLQQESGYALINSITHALNPGLLRSVDADQLVAKCWLHDFSHFVSIGLLAWD